MVLFVTAHHQQTLPRQMWNGIREQISPAILCVAIVLIVMSVGMLAPLEILRRRSELLRRVTPHQGRIASHIQTDPMESAVAISTEDAATRLPTPYRCANR